MMFDNQDSSPALTNGPAFEPLKGRTAVKKSLRGKGGALMVSSAMIAAGAALTLSGEAVAQGVPAGFAPAPSDVVSYVQLSNGSVLVQLANQQFLLVTSNNFFIDAGGVLYLSPSVSSGISGGGAMGAVAPSLPVPSAPIGTTNLGQTSTGVIFDDVSAASASGGLLGTITGGPGFFGLGTLGTIAAVGLGGGAILLAANAIREQLSGDDGTTPPTGDNQAATLSAVDDAITVGETGGTLTYAITDQDGIDESDLIASIEAGLDGASTVASIFPNGASVTTERTGSGLVEGTEDTFRSINVTLTGDVAASLNVGEFAGPAVAFNDAAGNPETVNFSLNISSGDDNGGGDGGGNTGASLELNAADGGTYTIPQGGTYLFKATDSDGDTISYDISNNPTGVGIDSNTGLVTVAASVPTGTHTITVKAMSTNADGTVDTDIETYNIDVTASGNGTPSNNVDADFDSTGAGFSTLTGSNITNSALATNSDDEFEVPRASDLANSYVIDGLASSDTLYFSELGATYHLDPTDKNSFEDVSGFETLSLLSGVNLELNGGVLDSTQTGDIEYIQGTTENKITLVNTDVDMGLDVSVTGVETIDMNN